jgi:hypothetical protein
MALPPGTFGWVGSGFDCTCECNFVAGFAYNGNEPPAWATGPQPICALLFGVGNLTNGCTAIDIDTADLTVELFRNGTPITEPLITDSTLNLKYWERWEPVAGDVYTATVTLNCGTTITIREYSFTIPTPANTSCVCCDERTPDYVTVSGLTGSCCDFGNGTYAMTADGSCEYRAEADFSDPGNCDTYCYTCNAARGPGIPDDIFYFSPRKVTIRLGIGRDPITATSTPNADTVVIYLRIEYWVYRVRDIGGGTLECSLYTSGVPSPCATANEWRMTSTCNGAAFTFTSSPGFGAICVGQTPTVELFWE